MESHDALTIGQRVARCRKARGMTQEVLAHQLGKSMSWLTKVERGERHLDRMSLIVEIARLLRVEVAEITGQPQAAGPRRETGHASVPALRRVLLGYEPSIINEWPDVRVDSIDSLRARLSGANDLRHHAELGRLADLLPPLLEDLQVACDLYTGDERDDSLALLAEACHCARALLTKLGYLDLAWIAAERGAQAAERLGDPLLRAANAWNRVEICSAAGARPAAGALASSTIDKLDAGLGVAPPGHASLLGMMHLKAALVSAHLGNERDARIHLDEAEDAAQLLGADRNDYETLFGPTNVAIYRVGIAVEMGDTSRALAIARHVDISTIASRERQLKLRLDVARAYAQLRRDDLATRLIVESERAAPDYVRNHPVAREVVGGMMRRARRTISADLRALVQRLGAG